MSLDLSSRLFSKLPDSDDLFYVITSDIRENITEGLSEKVTVEYMVTDTIKFMFPEETSKEIPVALRKNVSYRDQYMPVGELRLKPDKVLLYGEKSILDEIDSVFTEMVYLNGVNSSVTDIVALEKIPGLRYSEDEIYYTINVERYIEESFRLPVRVMNVPDTVSILTSPSEAMVTCRIPFKGVRSFNGENTIELVSDYRDMRGAGTSMLMIRPLGEISGVLGYRIEPSFLEVIVIGKIE